MIAGILRPTSGTVMQRGRLAALLELGAGFHPELTGRENVYLNASFLGLTRKETDAVYDEIVDFAELEDFMDNQVKFYSSGMLVRLGFAVAVHVDPDILLIDEVLAVGDEAFQAKCLDRVRTFQREGRTIVLVTHALDTVREICDRAVMLHHGVVHAHGMPDDVVREMRYVLLGQIDQAFVPEQGTREAEIAGVDIIRANGLGEGMVLKDDPLTIQVDVRTNEPVEDLDVDFQILDGATNHPVLEAKTSTSGVLLEPFDGKKRVRFRITSHPGAPGEASTGSPSASRGAIRASATTCRRSATGSKPSVPGCRSACMCPWRSRSRSCRPMTAAEAAPASAVPAADVHSPTKKGPPVMLIAMILVSVTLAAVAQLTLKHAMNQVKDSTGVVGLNTTSLKSILETPAVWGGLALFGISALVWLAVLSRASLSFAYPFVALTYILILLFDRFVLNQQVGALRWTGVAFIVAGIVLVAQTPHGGSWTAEVPRTPPTADLAVVIVNYNTGDYLERCLASLATHAEATSRPTCW